MNRSHSGLDTASRILRCVCGVLSVLCVITLLVLLISSGCSGSSTNTDTTSDSASESVGTKDPIDVSAVVLPETPDAGQEYQDKLTFLGDSLTAHLVSRGVLSGGKDTKQVWRTADNMLNLDSPITTTKIRLPGTDRFVTIAEAAAELKPEILIITLGTDYGISYLTEKDFKAYYTKLLVAIREASPDTAIILQSIFPVAATCKVLSNEKIDRANEWVKSVAAENGCHYLDTQSVLKGADNCLPSQYCVSDDGIHLTTEAYRLILSYIRTHAYTA